MSTNTGNKIYIWLEERFVLTNLPTGFGKPNVISDPDYVAPVTDLLACPLPATTTTTTTTAAPSLCGGLEFTPGSYYEIYTDDGGGFTWNLPINMSLLTSITSWSLRVQTSQTCRNLAGEVESSLDSWDVLVTGASGLPISSITSGGDLETGNLNSGNFIFDPTPYLTFSSSPCGGLRKVWQDLTTITLTINYIDLCSNPQTFTLVSTIPSYRVTGVTTSSGGTCLLKGSIISLSNEDEKEIEYIVPGDILYSYAMKEDMGIEEFKNTGEEEVEVERVDSFIVDTIYDVNGLSMTSTHKHTVLRKGVVRVVEVRDILPTDKVYIIGVGFRTVSIKERKGEFEVYNIQIKGENKFYFANQQLTHNKTMAPKEPTIAP